MDHVVGIKVSLYGDNRVLRRNVQGGINVQFLLSTEVESWLEEFTPGWELTGGGRHWEHIPEIQIWWSYRYDSGSQLIQTEFVASFVFQEVDHAVLFKLTWGGL